MARGTQAGRRHDNQERVHSLNRIRNNVGPKGIEVIARRVGLPWLRFRAYIGRALDWFKICLRNGWLGSHRTQNQRVLTSRRLRDLDIPYGEKARALSLARDGP